MLNPTASGAGIILVAANGQALFVKRGPDGDLPGTWCFPGGHIEEGETPEQAARREFQEETGNEFSGKLALLMRNVAELAPGSVVDFTTFLAKGGETFEPKLNAEHVGYAWAPLDQPPEPMHPGCRIAINRMTMDELDIARAIRDGQLSSPQHYLNVSLFALRITGTGTSYRSRDNEFVYRRPENYLNPDFLERCNGLAVILEHPKKTRTLTSQEFNDRAVGSIMLPYIFGDEVWGVAKIYDAATAIAMEAHQISTSPCVCFRHVEDNTKLTMDGQTILIEGKPSLLDHLAICERGVWDKGEEPSGIRVDSQPGATSMPTPEELKAKADAEAKIKSDADAGTKLDKLLEKMDSVGSRMDSVCSRMDAFEAKEKEKADADEKAKADAEEAEKKAKADADEKAEKEKADAEAKEKADAEAKEKADAEAKAKADAGDVSALKKRIDAIDNKLKPVSDADLTALADAQAKADSVYQAHGQRAARPLDGEGVMAYRKRMVGGLKAHSPRWKDSDIAGIHDAATFSTVEGQVFADSMEAALVPIDMKPGELRKIVHTDPDTGLKQINWRGTTTFIHGMTRTGRRVQNINAKRA